MDKDADRRPAAPQKAVRQPVTPATVVRRAAAAEVSAAAALQNTLTQLATQLESAELAAKPEIYTMVYDELLTHLQRTD